MKMRSQLGVAALWWGFTGVAIGFSARVAAEEPKPVLKASQSPTAQAKGMPAAGAAALGPAELKRREQPVATFHGGQITLGQLEDTVATQNPFMRGRYREPKALKDLLDRMVRFELMAREAERSGWDKKKSVQEAVAQNAVQLMMRVEFDEKISTASIPKSEIEAYYKAHIDEYEQPAMQRVSHVLVATEAEAKQLLAQAKNMDVRGFRQLARDKSIDEATKAQGGDLHYFDAKGNVRGENASPVPPAIVKAAFTIEKVGDTLPRPVKTERGYSILKLTGSRPMLSRKLPEVEETIRAKLWRETRERAVEAFVAKLREEHKPELHPELIELIKLEPVAEKRAPSATTGAGPEEESRLSDPEGDEPESPK